jgi:hypothetical protein
MRACLYILTLSHLIRRLMPSRAVLCRLPVFLVTCHIVPLLLPHSCAPPLLLPIVYCGSCLAMHMNVSSCCRAVVTACVFHASFFC